MSIAWWTRVDILLPRHGFTHFNNFWTLCAECQADSVTRLRRGVGSTNFLPRGEMNTIGRAEVWRRWERQRLRLARIGDGMQACPTAGRMVGLAVLSWRWGLVVVISLVGRPLIGAAERTPRMFHRNLRMPRNAKWGDGGDWSAWCSRYSTRTRNMAVDTTRARRDGWGIRH